MNASELRIGNYVKATNDDVDYPYVITAKEIVFFEADESRFTPIPLTEKWLIDLGFDNHGYDLLFWKKDIGKNTIEFSCVYDYNGNSTIGVCYNEQVDVVLEYVHQLQNLYFALTGQELELL